MDFVFLLFFSQPQAVSSFLGKNLSVSVSRLVQCRDGGGITSRVYCLSLGCLDEKLRVSSTSLDLGGSIVLASGCASRTSAGRNRSGKSVLCSSRAIVT